MKRLLASVVVLAALCVASFGGNIPAPPCPGCPPPDCTDNCLMATETEPDMNSTSEASESVELNVIRIALDLLF